METLPQGESAETLDARWYKRFDDVYFEDYEKLGGEKVSLEHAKSTFLASDSGNPDLTYPQLEEFDFAGKEGTLLELKADVLESESNEHVRKIYRTKINELLATVRMLKAARDGDDRKFAKYSSFIYGAPSDENVGYLANSVRQAVEKNLENGSEVKKTATYAILKVLDSVTATTNREDFNKNQFPIEKNIKGNVENAEEVVAIFEETLREIGVDDWQVVIDTKRGLSAVSANQETKTVVVPSDEKIKERSLSKKKLAGLVEHEIKTHALRRYNGERSKLQLLGLGLDRNLKGEEGIATYAEQQVTGTKDFAGIPRYLAIAVAKGLGGTQRDFRETFEVMNNYYLSTLKDGEDLESKAQNAAWTTCLRIFRGTTCQTQGAVFAKDLAYFAGNKDVWHLVSNDSEVVDTFSLGKFDPTNSEHVYLLKQLGILDSDLDELEQGE